MDIGIIQHEKPDELNEHKEGTQIGLGCDTNAAHHFIDTETNVLYRRVKRCQDASSKCSPLSRHRKSTASTVR